MAATVEQRASILCTLTGLNLSSSFLIGGQQLGDRCAADIILHSYQDLARRLDPEAVRATQTWNYGALLMVSVSVVLVNLGLLDQTAAGERLKGAFGARQKKCDATPRHLQQLRSAVLR